MPAGGTGRTGSTKIHTGLYFVAAGGGEGRGGPPAGTSGEMPGMSPASKRNMCPLRLLCGGADSEKNAVLPGFPAQMDGFPVVPGSLPAIIQLKRGSRLSQLPLLRFYRVWSSLSISASSVKISICWGHFATHAPQEMHLSAWFSSGISLYSRRNLPTLRDWV